jgi:hypothetical protein
MAFPSLAEMKSNIAVKEASVESAPTTEASAPTPDQPEAQAAEGSDTNPVSETAPVSEVQDAHASGAQDAAPAEEGTEPGPIPYGRFKEKVDQAKTLKEMNEMLQQRLTQIEASVQEKQREPEPEKPDPILQKLESIEDYGGNEGALDAMKAMATELKTLREKSAESSHGVQELRIQKQVQKIESDIAGVMTEAGVHDKGGARVFVLESLSRDPNLKISDLVGKFGNWEKEQESVILSRLGMKRPEAKKPKEASPDVPPRPSPGGVQASAVESAGSEPKKEKKRVTLKDLRKTLGTGRRR